MYKHYGTNDAINGAVSSNKYTEIFFLFVVNPVWMLQNLVSFMTTEPADDDD